MKNAYVLFILVVFLSPLSAEERPLSIPSGVGVRVSSDGTVSLVVHAPHLEAGFKAGAYLHDFAAEDATYPNIVIVGAHAMYQFGLPTAGRELGIGAEVGTGIGIDDVEYDEYIDFGVRVSINQPISDRMYVSGIIYPLWLETRDVADVEDDWSLTAVVPKAAVALSVMF